MRVSLALALLCLPTLSQAAQAPAAAVDTLRDPSDGRLMPPEKVADHIWVMRQPDRLWAAVIGNVTIVEQADGVVLIDSGGTVPDGRDVVDAVAKLTPKPIKAVVITHWHNDHPFGVPAILKRFPNARIIGTSATADFIKTETGTGVGSPDMTVNQARRDRALKTVADLEKEAASPEVPADMRAQYAIEAKWIRARSERQMENYAVIPTETFADRLVIDDPVAPVELQYLGVGNTHGDLIAWLPKQRLVAAGDLVVAPTPYGFTISIKPWLTTLAKLEQLPFDILVPGHGRVQRDRAFLDTLKWSMRDIAAKAAAAAADPAMAKEKAVEAFDNRPHEERFGAADAWAKKWLNDYWLVGMFQTAFDEARGIPAPGK